DHRAVLARRTPHAVGAGDGHDPHAPRRRKPRGLQRTGVAALLRPGRQTLARSPAGYGPDKSLRLVVATTALQTLPDATTRDLATILPRPGYPRAALAPFAPAAVAEVVRLYGLRNGVEQRYQQVKHELGW